MAIILILIALHVCDVPQFSLGASIVTLASATFPVPPHVLTTTECATY